MNYKILIPEDITDAGKNYLREKGFEVIVTNRADENSLRLDAKDCDAILARTCPYPSDLFSNAPKLKCIVRYGSGYDNIDVKAAEKAGVYVCITPTANTNSVAEHTITLLLACSKNLINQDKQLRLGNWNYRNTAKGHEIKHKTLGIIGFGTIGRLVAQKAHYGFGMKVIAYDAYKPSNRDYEDYAAYFSNMDEVLTQADFVTIHVPSMPSTRHFFGKEQFNKMKPGSIFINTSRGDVIVEEDLYDALTNNHIHMAGLDVFSQEPCPADHPLFALDNVIVTPHNAALTYEAMDQMGIDAAMEIERILTGQNPCWPVNHPEK